MLTSVTLLFIRHGQQQPENGVIGRLSPLSKQGRLQAEALAAELAAGATVTAVAFTGDVAQQVKDVPDGGSVKFEWLE